MEHEIRLRRLTGQNAAYRGEIVAISRGWVARDGRFHIFAARFLDFALLTPDHLVLCSTGFFTRRPRRRVFKEMLVRLTVVPRGPEPTRTLRIEGSFSRPILLELRAKESGAEFARELLARTKPRTAPAASPVATAEPVQVDATVDAAVEPAVDESRPAPP